MKLLIVVLGLTLAVTAEEPVFRDYHLEIGIPERARIDAAEAAADFDGSRIIGGQVSALGAVPHLAGLQIELFNGQDSLCGASLISNTRLVTAAHCWRSPTTTARTFVVILGSVNYNSGGVRIRTRDVVTHPGYMTFEVHNDVAVIIRINHVNFNNNIRPVALATGSDQYVGVTTVAAGFGRTSDTSSLSSVARHVSLQVIDNVTCARSFRDARHASILCTSNSGGRSPCGGDSGGPLAVGNTLIGIANFASVRGCAAAPGGFARITYFASWLSSQ